MAMDKNTKIQIFDSIVYIAKHKCEKSSNCTGKKMVEIIKIVKRNT